jgi:hypothetical protein
MTIDMNLRHATCCICGEATEAHWGIPVDAETVLIVDNDFEGDWGNRPACERCWRLHAIGFFVGEDTRF